MCLRKILCAALAAMMILVGTSCDVLLEDPNQPADPMTENTRPVGDGDSNNNPDGNPGSNPGSNPNGSGNRPAETEKETAEDVTAAEDVTEEVTEEVTTVHVHIETVLEAVAPTCTEAGLLEGVWCEECGKVLVPQEEVPAGHIWGEWVIDKEADGTVEGSMHTECAVCKKTKQEIFVLSQGLEYVSNGDGTCSVSGIGTCTDTKIAIPTTHNGERVTSIGESAFRECSDLTIVVIPDGVKSIYPLAFYDCSGLNLLIIPNSVTSIGVEAFGGCISLTFIDIPDSVTTIDDYVFIGCSGLTSVRIPNGVTSIGEQAFGYCHGLTSVVIPDSVMSVGIGAFMMCRNLTSVVIPNSVTTIGYSAFYGCTGLTDIYFTGTESEWEAITKGEGWDANTGAYTIHFNYVPN